MRTSGPAREHRTGRGFHRHHAQLWRSLLEQACTSGDCAAGAHPGDKAIDHTIAVVPDLLGSGAFMHRRIGRIVELLQQIGLGNLLHQLTGQGDRPRHAFGAIGELQLCAVGPQHGPAFGAHRIRHGEDEPVAPRGSHHRQGNSGVATGGLHQHRVAWLDRAVGLGLEHHGAGDAVLDGRRWIETLQLGQQLSPTAELSRKAVEPHQRSAADQGGDVGSNGHTRAACPGAAHKKSPPDGGLWVA